jgi:CHASE2 domain-containing sensor protein
MAYEVVVIAVTFVSVAVLGFLVSRGQFEDLYIKARGPAPVSGQVALLTVGDEALYLWNPEDAQPEVTPRAMLAELIRFCDEAGAEVVVLDVLMDRAEPGDDVLANAIRETGMPVVAAVRLVETDPQSHHLFAAGITPALEDTIVPGFANLQEEEPWLFSEVTLVRKAPLTAHAATARMTGLWPMNMVGAEQSDDTVLPSLAMAGAFLKSQGDATELARRLGSGESLGLPSLPSEESVLINFRGREGQDGIPTAKASNALRAAGTSAMFGLLGSPQPITVPPEMREALEGRVVLIGRVDGVADESDRHATPYGFPIFGRADMAGVRIQAQILDTLLSGNHIRNVGGKVSWFLAVVLCGAVVLSSRWLRDDVHVVLWSLASALVVMAAAGLFELTDGLALELGPPLGSALVTLTALHVYRWSVEESRRT